MRPQPPGPTAASSSTDIVCCREGCGAVVHSWEPAAGPSEGPVCSPECRALLRLRRGEPPPVPVLVRVDRGVKGFQLVPEDHWELVASVDRRLTLDLRTGEELEDFRGYREREEARILRPLPAGVSEVQTEFYCTERLPPRPVEAVVWGALEARILEVVEEMVGEAYDERLSSQQVSKLQEKLDLSLIHI